MLGLLDFLFPLHCLHCGEKRFSSRTLLCPDCLNTLSIISLEERCPICFSQIEKRKICEGCQKMPPNIKGIAAAFELIGPIESLVIEYSRKNREALAKTLAAFIFLQLERLNWPAFEVILSLKEDKILAKALAKWMGCKAICNERKLKSKKVLVISDLFKDIESIEEKCRDIPASEIYGLAFAVKY